MLVARSATASARMIDAKAATYSPAVMRPPYRHWRCIASGTLGRLPPDADAVLAGAEAAEHPRPEVEAQRRHPLALIVAADQIAGRCLPLPAAPAVERVEPDQGHENALSGHLELAQLV